MFRICLLLLACCGLMLLLCPATIADDNSTNIANDTIPVAMVGVCANGVCRFPATLASRVVQARPVARLFQARPIARLLNVQPLRKLAQIRPARRVLRLIARPFRC
jgi:hypothetical protein